MKKIKYIVILMLIISCYNQNTTNTNFIYSEVGNEKYEDLKDIMTINKVHGPISKNHLNYSYNIINLKDSDKDLKIKNKTFFTKLLPRLFCIDKLHNNFQKTQRISMYWLIFWGFLFEIYFIKSYIKEKNQGTPLWIGCGCPIGMNEIKYCNYKIKPYNLEDYNFCNCNSISYTDIKSCQNISKRICNNNSKIENHTLFYQYFNSSHEYVYIQYSNISFCNQNLFEKCKDIYIGCQNPFQNIKFKNCDSTNVCLSHKSQYWFPNKRLCLNEFYDCKLSKTNYNKIENKFSLIIVLPIIIIVVWFSYKMLQII